ncbi:MAG: hypothetical protein EWM72_01091 [Nitrospira sp.]|nr:MAG: hypothetical protein EWM72_01091 [Nitrospira sp.]
MTRLSSGLRLVQALAFIGMVSVAGSITMSFADDQPPASANQTPAQSDASADVALDDVNPSIILKGSVWRTKPGIVFLKTPIGVLTLSSKTTLKDIRASQDVSFWIHEAHLAVDIHKRADGSLVHRYLSGPFKRSNGDEKKLLRWTPEGEKAFHLGTHEPSLAAVQDGDVVTVEVDEDDTVIGVHNLQFDLQIGQIPANGSDVHLLLSGTVSKLKSNFIFFRTPVGVVNVNAKIGIKNAKVGQTMTLHMHRHYVVADLSAPNATAPARRFLTGPLEFASPDHASVRLWTPDGEQTYPTDRGKAALAGAKEGSPITVELNGQGSVVEFHRPN